MANDILIFNFVYELNYVLQEYSFVRIAYFILRCCVSN